MPIKLTCSCGKVLKFADGAEGKLVACPACRQHVRVPGPVAKVAAKPVPPPPLPQSEADDDDEPASDSESAGRDDEPQIEYFTPAEGEPEFLCSAPKAIGRVLSAHTSLSSAMRPPTFKEKFVPAAFAVAGWTVALVVGVIAAHNWRPQSIPGTAVALVLGLGIPCVIYVVHTHYFPVFSFMHFSGHVGERGFASVSCSESRDKLGPQTLLLFEDAAELRVKSTHIFMNGAYVCTQGIYTWTDESGDEVCQLAGGHSSHKKTPERATAFHLANQAEQVWSMLLLNRVLQKLRAGGAWKFRLAGEDYIRLSSKSLQLCLKGQKQDFRPEDIAEMKISDGTISLKEPGARSGWFTKSGIHQFTYAEVANVRVFLLLMERLFGVPFADA